MEFIVFEFNIDRICNERDIERFKGFFSSTFKDNINFRNHKDKRSFNFPKIQYRLFDNGNLGIILMPNLHNKNELINKIFHLKNINLENAIYEIKEINYSVKNEDFSVKDSLFKYKFKTPWIALCEKNYEKYLNNTLDLNEVLKNNLLSNFKGLGITLNKEILVNGDFQPKNITLKDIDYTIFYGEFVTNVDIPNGLALGKRKSIGYGVVEKI
ncbi:CRISPR-associated endonuclease Cas6 [Clostridium tarantellae]|uniref:DNA repair protein n=1 Tax=Clostridium tarantellae TaxID=39493 RepID=A0A6I1MNB7_9CLOT|nr:CRISPR-associated endonuclease Cas6 [Clostridium tarantellae]MPQ44895.1 hypothetical protein [Clostridium tarantellae]